MTPLTAAEVANITAGRVMAGDEQTIVTGLTIDSRAVKNGHLFVAFEGASVDGHRFVTQALTQGASAAVITHPVELEGTSMAEKAVIMVPDALSAVQKLAVHERSTFSGPVIGVTGSNGKTTTKDMIRTVFSTGGACLATEGNLNTELGLPLTVLRREGTEQSMVLEMGMRGLGQIADLCRIAKPTAGIITNIGQSHLELLGSQERIAQAKGELLEALPADGIAALTYGDPWLFKIAHRCQGRVLWYGLDSAADAYATDLKPTASGTAFVAHILGQQVSVELPTRGQHNVVNAMGALLLGAVHDLNLSAMADSLRELPASVGRLRVVQARGDRVVIDDCYNASPLSMKASLRVLLEQAEGGQTVAILGDMFELGSYEQKGHDEVGEFCAEVGIGRVITVGERAKRIAEGAIRAMHRDVHSFARKEDLLQILEEVVPRNSTVLVKASRGMALEDIVAALTS